jgi:uncharacterized protein YbjQ (UPF0145 family)
MHISATNAIAGRRVLQLIGRIEAGSAWHAANGGKLPDDLRELVLRDLVRKAEDFDADAIIEVDYAIQGLVSAPESGVKLARILATGYAVKLSCPADRSR